MKRKRGGKTESNKMVKALDEGDAHLIGRCCFCVTPVIQVTPVVQLLFVLLYYLSLFCPLVAKNSIPGEDVSNVFPFS